MAQAARSPGAATRPRQATARPRSGGRASGDHAQRQNAWPSGAMCTIAELNRALSHGVGGARRRLALAQERLRQLAAAGRPSARPPAAAGHPPLLPAAGAHPAAPAQPRSIAARRAHRAAPQARLGRASHFISNGCDKQQQVAWTVCLAHSPWRVPFQLESPNLSAACRHTLAREAGGSAPCAAVRALCAPASARAMRSAAARRTCAAAASAAVRVAAAARCSAASSLASSLASASRCASAWIRAACSAWRAPPMKICHG